jgi:cytochrome c oxidase subunit 3
MSATTAQRPRELGPYVGMIVFLACWGMCFAGLFFAYAVARMNVMTSWPPPGVTRLPIAIPAINTAVLAASSLTFHRGLSAVRAGRAGSLPAWLYLTLGLGALFLVLQTVVWVSLYRAGLSPSEGIYGSVFWMLTVFHALHVLSALAVGAWLLPKALAGKFTASKHTAVRMGAMFWHFVDAIWVLMFFSVYVF